MSESVSLVAFMEELGLGDVDDIGEFSDGDSESKPAQPTGAGTADASDSEWDSTVKSDQPKPGILKKWNKVIYLLENITHTHACTHPFICIYHSTHIHIYT